MNDVEVRQVRRQLEGYRDLLKQIEIEEQKAIEIHERYVDLATPAAIRIEPKIGEAGTPVDRTSIYIQLFDEERLALARAAAYRLKAKAISGYIDGIDDEQKDFIKAAYIDGKRYWQIGADTGYSESGVRRLISRCLKRQDAMTAIEAGLL